MVKRLFFICALFICTFSTIYTLSLNNVYANHLKGQIFILNSDIAGFLTNISSRKDYSFIQVIKDISTGSDTSLSGIINSLKTELSKSGSSLTYYFWNLGSNDNDIENSIKDITGRLIDKSITTLTKRLEYAGIIKPVVERTGSTRISVEIPYKLVDDVKPIIQTTGSLSFNLCKDYSVSKTLILNIDKILFEKDQTLGKNQFSKYFNEGYSRSFDILTANEDNLNIIDSILNIAEVKPEIPNDLLFCKSSDVITSSDNKRFRKLFLVSSKSELTGNMLSDASIEFDENTGMPYVAIVMNEDGTREWTRVTGTFINKKCAIIFDGIVYSAPTIRTQIVGGKTWIQGIATLREAHTLSILIKTGALAIPLKILE